jgi:hypothetical protein
LAALLVSVEREDRMTVELDVFSGRPNPRWTLTDAEAAQIEERLRNLPSAVELVDEPLGYRGFILIDGQRRIVVGSDVVHVEQGEQAQNYRDAKGLEKYLQGLARERGYGELLEAAGP